MKFEKTHLDDITRCYCTSHMFIDDKPFIFFASENPTSPCNAYSGEGFSVKENVWEDRGGCMSIIPFETRKGEFLAVNEFYLKISPSLSKLVWGKYEDGKWIIKDLFNLPYLHRFDIFHVDDKDYVLVTTIARDKANKEDWTRPGQVYVGEIPADLENGNVVLRQLLDNQFRNHGYYRDHANNVSYVASDDGVYRIIPPTKDTDWKVEKVKDGMTSEAAVGDIDGDGYDEMITIEPFHGNTIKIYRLKDGKVEEIYKYPYELDFAHALKFDVIGGKKCFVGGIRRVDAELFVIYAKENGLELERIECGAGPANVDVIHVGSDDYILSANHTKNEAAIYKYIGE